MLAGIFCFWLIGGFEDTVGSRVQHESLTKNESRSPQGIYRRPAKAEVQSLPLA
jgi:hypothetical protein